MLDWIKNNLLELLNWITMGIIDCSYWICLIAAVVGMFLYVAGMKKAGKVASVSLVIYFILEALGLAIRSVR